MMYASILVLLVLGTCILTVRSQQTQPVLIVHVTVGGIASRCDAACVSTVLWGPPLPAVQDVITYSSKNTTSLDRAASVFVSVQVPAVQCRTQTDLETEMDAIIPVEVLPLYQYALRVLMLPRTACPLLTRQSYTTCTVPQYRATCVSWVLGEPPSPSTLIREFLAVQEGGGGQEIDPASMPVDDSNPALPSVLVSPFKGLLTLSRYYLGWEAPVLDLSATAYFQTLGSSSVNAPPANAPLLLFDPVNNFWVSQRSKAGLDTALSRTFANTQPGNAYVHASNLSLVAILHEGGRVFSAPLGDYTLAVETMSSESCVLAIKRCIRRSFDVVQVAADTAVVFGYPPRDTTITLTLELVDRAVNCSTPTVVPANTTVETTAGSTLCSTFRFAQTQGVDGVRAVMLSLATNTVVMDTRGVNATVTYCGPPGETLVGSVTGPAGTAFRVFVNDRVVVQDYVGDDLGFFPFTVRNVLVWSFSASGSATATATAVVPALASNGVYEYTVQAVQAGQAFQGLTPGAAAFQILREPSSTPTSSASETATGSETCSGSASPSDTPSVSLTSTLTGSPSRTKSASRSRTGTKSSSRSRTGTKSASRSRTGTKSSSRSRTGTKSSSRSRTGTKSFSRSRIL